MADAVTTQVLQDGEHLYVAKFTNISDGTGESKVTKVDVSALNPNSHGLACIGLKINKIYAQTEDMAGQMQELRPVRGQACTPSIIFVSVNLLFKMLNVEICLVDEPLSFCNISIT